MSSFCLSACPLVFLSSSERVAVGDKHALGVHSPGITVSICFCDIVIKPTENLYERNVEKIRTALKHDPTKDLEQHLALFERSLKTAYTDIELLTAEEMAQYKVFTSRIN